MCKPILTAPAGVGHSTTMERLRELFMENPGEGLTAATSCAVAPLFSNAAEIRRVYESCAQGAEQRFRYRGEYEIYLTTTLPQRVAGIFGTTAEYVRQIVGR